MLRCAVEERSLAIVTNASSLISLVDTSGALAYGRAILFLAFRRTTISDKLATSGQARRVGLGWLAAGAH